MQYVDTTRAISFWILVADTYSIKFVILFFLTHIEIKLDTKKSSFRPQSLNQVALLVNMVKNDQHLYCRHGHYPVFDILS